MTGRVVLPVALLALLALVWSGTSPTLSGWSSGRVVNTGSSAATSALAFSHSAGPCSLGPRVSATVACAGSPVGTDTITNTGTAPADQLAATVTAASCGPVQLVNRVSAARPLLARNNLAFRVADPWAGTNAVRLDGTAYAAATTQQTKPTTLARNFGIGVWFRAAGGASGPLFSFGTSPTATAGSDDRTVFLNPDGTVTFRFTASLVTLTSAAGTSYADGAWHFAYVRFSLLAGVASSFTLTVDDSATSATQVLTATGVTGYWHLGWAPTLLTGLGNAYFTGSLSNLVAFYATSGAAAPAAPTPADRASQAAFTGWAAAASEHWLLGDTGTTTYAGTEPVLGTTSPCTAVDLAWSFANPAGTAAPAGTRLSDFATGTPHAVPAPGPGVGQTSTLTTGLDPGNTAAVNAYVAGLRLYVPFTHVVATTSGAWPLIFSWSGSGSVVIP